MPSITFDRWEVGIDRRKGREVSDANRLWDLKNAYITTGWVPKKRPGLVLVRDFAAAGETGTKGLVSSGGKLNTFYANQPDVTHGSSLFQAHRVEHASGGQAVKDVWFGDTFNGYLYVAVEYANGDLYHHYLQDAPNGAWAASTAYTAGQVVRPVTANGYWYSAQTAGTTGATEPAWPTTIGATVTDGTVTWVCRSTYIDDPQCPHSKAVLKAASKIFAASTDTVRFSDTNAPRVWTSATTNDAGSLPTGLQAPGSPTPLTLGLYNELMVVGMVDSMQTWNVDPDSTLMSISEIVRNVGSEYPRAMGNISGDTYFLSRYGVRSISTLSLTQNLADVDVGSPIDSIIEPILAAGGVNPIAVFFQGGGQLWIAIGAKVFVYTFSRTAKVSAWSYYEYPFTIDAMTEHEGEIYLRAGEKVYRVDDSVYTDDGTPIPVTCEMSYQAMKRPGQRKHVMGADFVVQGNTDVEFLYDARDPTKITQKFTVNGDTRPGGVIPVELNCTEVAIRFSHSANEPWELRLATLYYQLAGIT